MAHKLLKSKAYKLFSKGWNPPETAEKIGASLRSTQRWHQEFLQDNPDFAIVGKMPVAIVPIEEAKTTQTPIKETPKDSQEDNWTIWASNLSDTHGKTHGEIREKMARMLNAALDSSEVNIRAIHVLSQCLCRHTEVERVSGFLYMLDINKAAQKLTESGYLVIDPREEQNNLNS